MAAAPSGSPRDHVIPRAGHQHQALATGRPSVPSAARLEGVGLLALPPVELAWLKYVPHT
jgi:hypothetical protein